MLPQPIDNESQVGLLVAPEAQPIVAANAERRCSLNCLGRYVKYVKPVIAVALASDLNARILAAPTCHDPRSFNSGCTFAKLYVSAATLVTHLTDRAITSLATYYDASRSTQATASCILGMGIMAGTVACIFPSAPAAVVAVASVLIGGWGYGVQLACSAGAEALNFSSNPP